MRKKWIMGFIVAAIAAIVGVGAVLAASPTSAPSAPALQDDGGDSATSTRPFQELRLGHRLAGLIPRLVQGDLQVLGEDGQVITVTVTPGKVVGVTSTLLTIERRDGQQAQFSVATTTPVIKGKHRVGLDALEEGNPVVVIQKDGDVVAVIVGAPHPPKPRLRPRDREEPVHPPEFRGRPGKALERVLRNFGEQMKRQQHALGEHLGRMQHRIDSLEARIATLEEAAQ